MKVLLITPTYLPIVGGAEIGVFEIYRRLKKKHQVKILTPWPDKKLIKDFGTEEATFETSDKDILRFKDRVNLMKWPGQWRLKGIIPPFSLSSVLAALKNVKTFEPDIVNVFYALPTGLAALFVKSMARTPVVISLIGRDIPGPNIPQMWKIYARSIVKTATDRIFISQYCRRSLFKSDIGIGEVIPFGVDVEKFSPDIDGRKIRNTLDIPKSSKVLFSLQRLDVWKKVDVIIQAMANILKKKDVFLVLGGKGPEKERLVQMTADLGLTRRVLFAGYIKEEELPYYYAMSDIFMFHSTYETFGLVLLQAMAAGKPIISTNSTAIPELIENHKNGLLVEPLNPGEMANAALSLLDDEENRKRFSEESRRRVLEKYNWDFIAGRYEEIFSGYTK